MGGSHQIDWCFIGSVIHKYCILLSRRWFSLNAVCTCWTATHSKQTHIWCPSKVQLYSTWAFCINLLWILQNKSPAVIQDAMPKFWTHVYTTQYIGSQVWLCVHKILAGYQLSLQPHQIILCLLCKLCYQQFTYIGTRACWCCSISILLYFCTL